MLKISKNFLKMRRFFSTYDPNVESILSEVEDIIE